MLMAEILHSTFGFPAEQARLLLDGEAKKEAIRAEMHALLQRAAPDDIVVMYFSGLATRTSDEQGSQQSAMWLYDVLLVNPVRDGMNLVAQKGQ